MSFSASVGSTPRPDVSDALCRAPGEPLWVVAFAAVPGADHTVIVSMAAPDALCPVRGRASMGPVAHIAMENLVKGLGFRPPILGAVGMLAGALLTQKSCPPRSLDFSGME